MTNAYYNDEYIGTLEEYPELWQTGKLADWRLFNYQFDYVPGVPVGTGFITFDEYFNRVLRFVRYGA